MKQSLFLLETGANYFSTFFIEGKKQKAAKTNLTPFFH